MLQGKAEEGDVGGYYATNKQNYQPFEQVSYVYQGGGGVSFTMYQGYGYMTEAYNILLSPLNINIAASEFSIYAFIKYSPTANPDENYLASDEGSKYFQAVIPQISLDPNLIHYIIMAFDVEDLKVFLDSSSSTEPKTRSPWEGPEKIELKPVKVICR